MALEKIATEKGSIYKSKDPQYGGEQKKTLSLATIFENSVTDVAGVDYFIVIHTLPGAASTVAFHLDREANIGIVGTIAGDDTILVILDNKEKFSSLLELFKSYL